MGRPDEPSSIVRCTEPETLANISALLQLCQTGRLTCIVLAVSAGDLDDVGAIAGRLEPGTAPWH